MLELFSWPSAAPDRLHQFAVRYLAPVPMRGPAKLSPNTKIGTEESPVQRACNDAGSGRRSRAGTVSRENSGDWQTQIPCARADFPESGHPFTVRPPRSEQRQMPLLG